MLWRERAGGREGECEGRGGGERERGGVWGERGRGEGEREVGRMRKGGRNEEQKEGKRKGK